MVVLYDMNTKGKFLDRAADVLATDRADLWTKEEALAMLTEWMGKLEVFDETASYSTGSFKLTRFVYEDGEVEWQLDRHVLDYWEYSPDPNANGGFDWEMKLGS